MLDSIRLPFFPVPAEGETAFSAVGRCVERLGIANQHLLPLLTGQKNSTTLFSVLPGYLGTIARAMPIGHPWTDVKVLINAHTALPYFTYFHTQEQRNTGIELLAEAENSQPIALSLGLSIYRVPALAPSSRFCTSCLQEHSREPGISYFHRAHQLPAVTHCWRHGEVLSHGCLTCGTYPLKGRKLTMPGQCLCGSFAAFQLENVVEDSESARWLARESAYLLTTSDSQDDRQKRLRDGVIQAQLCRGALVDYDRLAHAIESRFGRDFLLSIKHPARDENGRPSAWIRRSLPNKPSGKRLSTIVGLLVLGAAFDSVEAFERKEISSRHMICSEPEPPSKEESLPASWATNLKQLLEAHQYRISTCAAILKRSSSRFVTEARSQQIAIPLSTRAIARIGKNRLQNIRTQLRQGIAKEEILSTQQISGWTLQLIELDDPTLAEDHHIATANVRRDKHRARVIEFLKSTPEATRQALSVELSGTYDFLISQDNEWFSENVSKAGSKKACARSKRCDWETIDKSLADAILATGNQMLTSDEDKRPQRITASLLLNRHRALQKYTAQRSRFPLTSHAIHGLVETPEQYIERKVRWGIQRLVASKREISVSSLRCEIAIPDARLKRHIEIVRRVLEEMGAVVSNKSILQS